MLRKSLLITSLGVTLALAGASALASHSWNNYHWARTTSSFNLSIVDSVTSVWQPMFNASVSQWSASAKLNLVPSQGSETSSSRRRCSAISGKVRVCNSAYGNNGWLGLASINLDSNGHISQGTAKMNDSYSSSFTTNERYHVMCQEVGHTFGLGHTSEDGSSQSTCMDYSQSPSSTAPNAHDYDELAIIYQHLDSYNSASSNFAVTAEDLASTDGSRGQLSMAGETPMGVLVHRERFSEEYVAPDGKGGLWINHVLLAPGFENNDLDE